MSLCDNALVQGFVRVAVRSFNRVYKGATNNPFVHESVRACNRFCVHPAVYTS
jgi:hypothetical protein